MPAKGRQSGSGRRQSSEFVRRAAGRGEQQAAMPHAFLKQRALGLMKQPMRTDLFRPAFQPHEFEEMFVSRTFNFVEVDGPVEPAAPPEEPSARPAKRRPPESDERIEPQIDPQADEPESFEPEDEDLDLPPARRPLEAGEKLDLPDLEEYDGSELFDQENPDAAAEPIIPAEERTELPSALRNRRSYYEKSDARKSKLLGGIIPGGGKPASRSGPGRR
ncbi:MAG: hypothetical protein ACOC91_00875 [bacterium]